MLKRHIKFFNQAMVLAAFSQHKYYHMGAIIARKNKGLSAGVNTAFITHPILRAYGYPEHCYLHAETSAIVRSEHDLTGSVIYVARLRKDGSYGISKPCAACMRLIITNGIKKVVYYDGKNIQEMTL